MKKTKPHPAPRWLDPLERSIGQAVFRYEVARRTPEGRKRQLPRWDVVPLGIRLALRTALSDEARPPWSITITPGYSTLTLSVETPPAINSADDLKNLEEVYAKRPPIVTREPLLLDLRQPDAVLLGIVKTALRHLRAEHRIRPRKAPAQTRGTPWKWLDLLDRPRGLDDTARASVAKARKIGRHFLPDVLHCFDHPAEVIRQHDAQLFQKPK